ncbi:MAG: dihydroxyacetone kinase subunit DhaL [Actinomycetota bacterium]|nr:dihydroxyacetone kinase subunit DhaL [Actinomycetota bacterium]
MSSSAVTGADVVRWIELYASTIAENKGYLTELDSAIGDADHGSNMNRGMNAVVEEIGDDPGDDIGGLLKTVGMTLVSKVGGAGGPLYGTLFMQMGAASAGKSELSVEDWSAALQAALTGVKARGKAEPGDKTMIDALTPAAEALSKAAAESTSFTDALKAAESAAEEGMKATIPLVARKGRASYLGERSAGHQDPGATSTYLLMKTASEVLGSSSD